MKLRAFLISAVLGSILIGSCICVFAKEPVPARAVYNRISDDEEIAVGEYAAAEVEQALPVLHDRLLDLYLTRLGEKVAKVSRRPGIKYRFHVINDDQINAFSLPGGYIYVHRGLLDFVQNESELAAVLSHEVGHVAGYHLSNAFAQQLLAQQIISQGQRIGIINEKTASGLLARVGGSVAMFVHLKFERIHETQADLLGFYNLVRGRWQPQGMISLLERLATLEPSRNDLEVLLQDHPLSTDRVQTLQLELKDITPDPKWVSNTITFTAMKARLKLLAPTPKSS